jgi:hypothetical protein
MDEIIKDEFNDTTYLHSNYKSCFIDEDLSTRSSIIKKQDEVSDIIPTSIKILYSIPSFGKMSCLVLLK